MERSPAVHPLSRLPRPGQVCGQGKDCFETCSLAQLLTHFQNVLIMAYSASGYDISTQLAGMASNIIVSTSRPDQFYPPGVTHVVPRPATCDVQKSVVTFHQADNPPFLGCTVHEIILSTGYEYDFIFLQKRDGTQLLPAGFEFSNLFQHMIYIKDKFVQNESLAFVGLPKQGLL